MRTFNLRLVLWLAGIFLIVAVTVHFVHGVMVRKNAIVYRELAEKAAATALDEHGKPDDRIKAAEDAVSNYRRFLAFRPREVKVRADYGNLLYEIGAKNQAYLVFARVLRDAEDSAGKLTEEELDDVRRKQLQLAISSGQLADAKEQLRTLLAKNPTDGELLEQKGILHILDADSKRDAIDAFEAAIANAPDRPTAYVHLARLYRDQLGDAAEARTTIDSMVTANPESADAYLYRARFLLEDTDPNPERTTERLSQATQDCALAMEHKPDNVEAMATAAVCAQRQGEYDRSLELLRKAIALQPGAPRLYGQLAEIEWLAGRGDDPQKAQDAAIQALRDGIAAIPDKQLNFELRWRLADRLIDVRPTDPADTSAVDEARRIREELRAERETEPKVLALVSYLDARQLYRDQKWYEAREKLEQTRDELSGNRELQVRVDEMLSACYAQLGDQDLRLTAVRRLLDTNPLSPQARQLYAEALVAVGRLKEAIDEYDTIFRMLGDKVPAELFKRSFVLRLNDTAAEKDAAKRNWAALGALLDRNAELLKDDSWLPIMRAELALAAGDKAEARDILLAATKEDQLTRDDQAVWLALVETTRQDGDDEGAAKLLADIEQKFGDSIRLRIAKARLIVNQKGKDGLAELAGVLAGSEQYTDAERAQLYLQCAQLGLAQGDLALGMQYGQQAAQYAPKNLQIRLFLLRLARELKDVDRAEQVAGEIQRIEQGGAVTLYAQAMCDVTRYLASGQEHPDVAALADARNKLQQAQLKRPNWVQIPLLQGYIAGQEANDGARLGYYQRAIELGNRDMEVIGIVARLLMRIGRLDEAYAVIQKLEEQRAAPSVQLATLASQISASQRDYERAIEWAEIPVESRSTNPDDYVWLGQLYEIQDDLPKAKAVIQQAIDMKPEGASEDGPAQLKDGVPYLAMVRLLVSASDKARQAADELKAAGAGDDDPQVQQKEAEAQSLRDEAASYLPQIDEKVVPEQRVQTRAQCLGLLGRQAEALACFEEALQKTPDDPMLLEAAARYYLSDRLLSGRAVAILERFVKGEIVGSPSTLPWARRSLAERLAVTSNYQTFQRAMQLVDANLADNSKSPADLALRASLLASSELPSMQKEAVKILEYMNSPALALPPDINRDYMLAQLYIRLGDWLAGSSQLFAVVSKSKATPEYPEYLRIYIDALLDHYEASDARLWTSVLKLQAPKMFATALLEARTLMPKKRPEPDAVAPVWQLEDALKILHQAIEDPEVKVAPDQVGPEDQKRLKIGVVLQLLEDALIEATDNRTSLEQETLKQPIEQYYDQIVQANPMFRLVQVPYLVRQGQRQRALDLIRQNWETTETGTLISACTAMFAKESARRRIDKMSISDAEKEQLKAALAPEAAEVVGIVQQALLKKQKELEGEQDPQKQRALQAEAINIMALLADYHLEAEQYDQTLALYTEILKRSPNDVRALNNRAMILASQRRELNQAVSEIDQAISLSGPHPVLVDSQAIVLLAAGKKAEALQAAKRVMTEKPDRLDPAVNERLAKQWGGYYFHLAWISDANGDKAAAIAALQEAIKLRFSEEDVFKPELPVWKTLVQELGI